jgi:hypothetical protein
MMVVCSGRGGECFSLEHPRLHQDSPVAQELPVVDPLASPRAGAVTRISCPWRKARDAAATAA